MCIGAFFRRILHTHTHTIHIAHVHTHQHQHIHFNMAFCEGTPCCHTNKFCLFGENCWRKKIGVCVCSNVRECVMLYDLMAYFCWCFTIGNCRRCRRCRWARFTWAHQPLLHSLSLAHSQVFIIIDIHHLYVYMCIQYLQYIYLEPMPLLYEERIEIGIRYGIACGIFTFQSHRQKLTGVGGKFEQKKECSIYYTIVWNESAIETLASYQSGVFTAI